MQHSEDSQSQDESPLNTAFILEDSKLVFSDVDSINSEVHSISSIPYFLRSQTSWGFSDHSNDFEEESVEEKMH